MQRKISRPNIREISINDKFWTPYINRFRRISIPHMLENFEKDGYLAHFDEVARGERGTHKGVPFSDGLFFETMRGISDFLASHYDAELDAKLDSYIGIVQKACAASPDGFICTKTTLMYPDKRFGENGGDLVIQHDLYDMGCLVEAAVSHYNATGKTSLLQCAVKAANLICSHIGKAPKTTIIPGHSLPEEAFIKLYRLFRDNRELDTFAKENDVCFDDYFDIAKFWYDARGTAKNSEKYEMYYSQNHATFTDQTTAEGHCVRAALCYLGATAVAYETGDQNYAKALDTIWNNAVLRRMHINGGIGSRHEIEAFSTDYDLPNDAYLETCAGVALAFWNGEMSLICPDGKYFDSFELSLFNNILGAISDDGTHFTYTNALIDGQSKGRWHWHGCPCCPPMLSKFLSNLGTYIYSVRGSEGGSPDEVYINLYIDSTLEKGNFSLKQSGREFTVNSCGKETSLHIRIPCYAENPVVTIDGSKVEAQIEKGYMTVTRVWNEKEVLEVSFETSVKRVCANAKIIADAGMVAVMKGPVLYCAEGLDNDGETNFTLSAATVFTCEKDIPDRISKVTETLPTLLSGHPDLVPDNASVAPGTLHATCTGGKSVTLIPYYRRNNRGTSVMRVWLKQEGLSEEKQPLGNIPYAVYNDN